MASGSRRAVVTAIVGNGTLTVLKFAVALPPQSAALMHEAVHSLMATLHQVLRFTRKAESTTITQIRGCLVLPSRPTESARP